MKKSRTLIDQCSSALALDYEIMALDHVHGELSVCLGYGLLMIGINCETE